MKRTVLLLILAAGMAFPYGTQRLDNHPKAAMEMGSGLSKWERIKVLILIREWSPALYLHVLFSSE